MNLRLSDGAVRLRLEARELERLLNEGCLFASLSLPGGFSLRYGLRLRPEERGLPPVSAEASAGELVLNASRPGIEALRTETARAKLALRGSERGVDGAPVELAVELDVFSARNQGARPRRDAPRETE